MNKKISELDFSEAEGIAEMPQPALTRREDEGKHPVAMQLAADTAPRSCGRTLEKSATGDVMMRQGFARKCLLQLLCLLALLLGGQVAHADTDYGVIPTLACTEVSWHTVSRTGGLPDAQEPFVTGKLGYDNTTNKVVDIKFSNNNYFIPGTADVGQPTEFLVGKHASVFEVTYNSLILPSKTWYLSTHTVRVEYDPTTFCPPRFDTIVPDHAAAGTSLSLKIEGGTFKRLPKGEGTPDNWPAPPQLDVWLKHDATSIKATDATAPDFQHINATFDIPASAPAGDYNLVLQRPNGKLATVANAVSISNDQVVSALAQAGATTMYAALDGKGVYASTDSGAHWTARNSGLTDLHVLALQVAATDPAVLYAGTRNGVFKSSDGATSWQAIGLDSHRILSLKVLPSDAQTVFAGTGGAGVFKTTDGGGTWTAVNTGLPVQSP